MTPAQMMSKLLDEARADGVDISHVGMVRDARTRWPEHISRHSHQITERGLRYAARDAIRQQQKDAETQQVIPGLNVPAWFTIPTEGGPIHRPLNSATMSTWVKHGDVLKKNVAAVTARSDEQQILIDRCFDAGATDDMAVEEAIALWYVEPGTP